MPSLTINNADIYYLQDGTGDDVVLLHGLASNLAFWYSGVMVPLRRQYRVTAYDLRGHGKSSMPSSGYTHYAMAEDLAGLAEALQLRRFHLIGHSYGGLVAITYAQKHPGHLLSLTLADVPVDDTITGDHQGENNTADKYPELGLLEQLARNPVKPDCQHAPFIPFHRGKGSGRTAQLWLKLLETTSARQDFQTRKISLQELQSLQIPALLTYGLKSGWKNSGELLKKHLPDTSFVSIQNAGHAHPWEKPGLFLQSWLEFVQALDQRPTPDRRQHLRNGIHLPLELQFGDGRSCRVQAVDVSTTGILIRSPEDFHPDATIWLVPNDLPGQVAISGRVVRHNEIGGEYLLGIQFVHPADDHPFIGFIQDVINRRKPEISPSTIEVKP